MQNRFTLEEMNEEIKWRNETRNFNALVGQKNNYFYKIKHTEFINGINII